MNVFVLMYEDDTYYGTAHCEGVFSTRELAELKAEKQEADFPKAGYVLSRFFIEEWDLNNGWIEGESTTA